MATARDDPATEASGEDAQLVAAAPDVDVDRLRELVHRRVFDTAPRNEPERAATPGRYLLLELIGRGAMGSVHSAYDPALDRKIAIKLITARGGPPAAAAERRTRMVREARALAKLSHPNVVTLLDAGVYGEDVFLAMELVQGQTLHEWASASPRSWVDVLDALLQAGRGLAAAHAAGILHRDFKPQNLMIDGGEHGRMRVRVMDFGLARPSDASAERTPVRRSFDDVDALTRTGQLMGTPAYMAPELLTGAGADARSDQFSFCVAAWELLFGVRPFVAASGPALMAAILAARSPSAPAGTRVPRWLRQVILRGLAREPDARWPTMDALVAALAQGRARARTRRALGFAALLGIGASAAYGAHRIAERETLARCERIGAELEHAWNDDVRAQLIARFGEASALGATSAQKVQPWIDDYARAWADGRRQACLGAEDERWAQARTDASLWCLDERRLAFESLLAQLVDPDRDAVLRAVSSAAGLPPVAPCTDERSLAGSPAPAFEQREELRTIVAALVSPVRGASAAQEEQRLATIVQRSQELGWASTTARARIALAARMQTRGDNASAELVATEAFHEAARAGAWNEATRAATLLVQIVAIGRSRAGEGLAWGRLAETAETHTLGDRSTLAADRLANVGVAYELDARPNDACAALATALLLHAMAQGPEHPQVAAMWCRLGITYRTIDDYDAMRRYCGEAVRIAEAAYGADHPDTVDLSTNVGVTYLETGDCDHAEPIYERATAIFGTTWGREHTRYATARMNLGSCAKTRGDYARARTIYDEVLAIRERTLAPGHARIATSLRYLAELDLVMNDARSALPRLERALAIISAARGAEHPEVALYLQPLARAHEALNDRASADAAQARALAIARAAGPLDEGRTRREYGALLRERGDRSGAREQLELALQLTQSVVGADAGPTARTLAMLGDVELEDGRVEAAERHFTRAVAIYETTLGVREDECDAQAGLARTLVAQGRERARAVTLARAAIAAYRTVPGNRPARRAALEDWAARELPEAMR
ncbi:MAG TPA: serine/threonine-protein kinase [Nannocystaceae bacterium]|nr:serine/threonine-protein kinase [Nannocystaceae bacterium]